MIRRKIMNNNHQQNGAKGPPIFTLIAACALMINTSSLARREVGDLGGVGKVQLENSGSTEVQGDLMRGHALLHSMFYDEAIAVLNGVATKEANCAMAHWGVAMAYYHPLWAPATPEELKNGAAALAKAKEVMSSQREKDFVAALEGRTLSAPRRSRRPLGELASRYPNDVEAQAFHALMLLAMAPPGDQTFTNQKAAGEVLEKLWVTHPDHPGLPQRRAFERLQGVIAESVLNRTPNGPGMIQRLDVAVER
jgi:hypothetical protein